MARTERYALITVVAFAMIAGCAEEGSEKGAPQILAEMGQVYSPLPPTEACDNADNNQNLVIDEGCDDDADQWCDEEGVVSTPPPDICPKGAGDCDDDVFVVNPGALEGMGCDGYDNNCDGKVDNSGPNTPINTSCYTGPEGTEEIDPCHGGTVVCYEGGWSDCIGERKPILETCNGIDDDCDGQTDEIFKPELGTPCDTADSDFCANGTWACTPDNQGFWCPGESVTGIKEICNGVDDDCDGATDEDSPLKGMPCDGSDLDVCPLGQYVCTKDNSDVECSSEVMSFTEVCDYADNDCDGVEDNGFDVGASCDGPDSDLCKNGVKVCNEASNGTVCSEPGAGNVEVCNNKDDDCDGLTDILPPPNDPGYLTQPCYSGPEGTEGVGLCKAGEQICVNGGIFGTCTGEVTPTAEVCDSADNDCDGETDEGLCAPEAFCTGAQDILGMSCSIPKSISGDECSWYGHVKCGVDGKIFCDKEKKISCAGG